MSNREDPIESLEQFRQFDLEEMVQRRLAIYALRDFYGAVLSEVGQEYLQFRPTIRTWSPKKQWSRARTRLESLDDFDVPEEFEGLVASLHEISNDVDHNFDENPPLERTREIGERAEEWRDWLISQAEHYREVHGELDARETIIRITRETLNSVQRPPEERHYGTDEEQRKLNEEAQELMEKLDEIETHTEGVTNELVFLLSDAKELRQHEEYIDDMEHAADVHITTEIDRRLEEKAFRRHQAEQE